MRSEVRVGLEAMEGGGGDATDIGGKYYLLGEGKWEMTPGGRAALGAEKRNIFDQIGRWLRRKRLLCSAR